MSHVTRLLRTKVVKEPYGQEKRWFLTALLDALSVWDWLAPKGGIVFVREIMGSLFSDSEIEEGIREVPDWIATMFSETIRRKDKGTSPT